MEKEFYQKRNESEKNFSKIKELYFKAIQKPVEEKIVDYYIKYLKKNTNMKFDSILDIGTGYGYLIKKLKNNNECEGIESNPFKTKFAVTKNIKLGYFDENFQLSKKYDLICLTQVLPFLRNTKKILQHLNKHLNESGLIFIATQNPESKLIIQDYSNQTWESYYCNMIFSKKNFDNLKEIGLKMGNYSTFREEIALDFAHKNRILTFLTYKMNLKSPLINDPEGNLALILLKKIS